ncbi:MULTISPECIES: hypothetical protein [Enterobacteriaceae]|uniref:hypothetical protein n=1 Tax=Enterobacteriaceae TaxID=543 RepID=UPI001902954E|nr:MULTISPECIES: hypothetical protein [Enterobacteriaceae]MBJ9559788.1 hypothetical protein [Citrobacter sp. FDAARGOS_156]MBK4127700.1 hypothetical protein [Klebsiella michiganensis]
MDINIGWVVNYFAIAGAIATVVATAFAIIVFSHWKEQQEYLLKLNLLLDLEDKFSIYICRSISDFGVFYNGFKCVRDNANKDKRVVDEAIKKHFSEKLDEKLTASSQYEFELAHVRALRMIPELDDLYENIVKTIPRIQREYIGVAEEEDSDKRYSDVISETNNAYKKALKNYREGLKSRRINFYSWGLVIFVVSVVLMPFVFYSISC